MKVNEDINFGPVSNESPTQSNSPSRRRKRRKREHPPTRGVFSYLLGIRMVFCAFAAVSLIAVHEAFYFPAPAAKWKLILMGVLLGVVLIGGLIGGLGWIIKWCAEKPQRLAAKEKREAMKTHRRRRSGTDLTWQKGERAGE